MHSQRVPDEGGATAPFWTDQGGDGVQGDFRRQGHFAPTAGKGELNRITFHSVKAL